MPGPTATLPAHAPVQAPAPPRRTGQRWGSLDVLRGVALFMMVLHHFAEWSAGQARQRIVGFDGFVVTDLAAPIFGVGVGAAAYLVGRRLAPWASGGAARTGRTAWRWTEVLLAGLVIDVAVGGGIDGGGVLPTLAVVGAATTAAAALGLRRPGAWWGTALACAALVRPAQQVAGGGFFNELLNGAFSVAVYGVFAAGGAAVAAHALRSGRGEDGLPLLRAAGAVLLAGLVGAWLAPAQLAPEGLWPPDRYPGGLAFTAWGLAGTFLLWAGLRRLVPAESILGAAAARAGRRTLSLFVGHYAVKVVMQHAGLLETLDGWPWTVAALAAAVAVCTLATLDRPLPTIRTRT